MTKIYLKPFYSFLAFSDDTIGFYARKNIVSPIFGSWVQLQAEIEEMLSENRTSPPALPSTPHHRPPIFLVKKICLTTTRHAQKHFVFRHNIISQGVSSCDKIFFENSMYGGQNHNKPKFLMGETLIFSGSHFLMGEAKKIGLL